MLPCSFYLLIPFILGERLQRSLSQVCGAPLQLAQWAAMGGTGGTGGNLVSFCQQPVQQARFEAHVC